MSVLIKGMKMPKEGCKDCPLVKRGRVFDICPLLKREVNGNVERGGKPYGCPLVELPDHGDLIDRDEYRRAAGLAVKCEECSRKNYAAVFICQMARECGLLDNALAVIPAERNEE